MNIIIRANCITPTLAAALEILFPEATVYSIHGSPNQTTKEEIKKAFVQIANSYYYVVTQWPEEFTQQSSLQKIIKIPNIYFNAFHPDLVYCKRGLDGQFTNPHYNSRIVLESFRMGESVQNVSKLFNSYVYEKLGYFKYWDKSVFFLKKIFSEAGYDDDDFKRLFRRMSRVGIFMHSTNHPRVDFLIELVKMIGRKINAERDSEPFVFNILDSLITNYIFPVYPEIALELGLTGSYIWALPNRKNYDLESFIRFSYDSLLAQGFAPDDLVFDISESQRIVLREFMKK